MLKSEAAAYLAGVTRTEGAEASAPTNLHVITGEVGEASADGKTLVKIDGLMFSESDDQFIEVDALGGLEEGDIATIVLTGEQGHAMTPLALGSIGSVDRITVRIAAIEADYIKVEQLDAAEARIGELEADHVSVDDLDAATARIGTLETTRATITDLEAATARIGTLEADHVSTDDFSAATARIGTLETNTADIGTIRANSAKVQNLTAAELEADHATVGSLSTNYAHITNGVIDNATIGYADVNNLSAHYAEIQNGKINSALIDTAAIVDEQVFTVTGNKATLAQIDASKINVLNLKAKDIEVERINGQPVTNKTLVDALSQHESDISDLDSKIDDEVEALNDRIDGAIETFTGTVVPTLENTPASQWNTVKLKDQHVGDVYYVVNSQSAQNGYCYRFTKSGSTYSWQLIKDSDVTAALSRLQTAEGKISNIETFDETVGSFMTNTDDEISSLKTRATTLETSMGDKVDTSTFNTVSQKVDANEANITSMSTVLTNNGLTSSTNITNTVNSVKQTATGNSSKITQLTTTLGTNADGTTKTGDIVHRTSAVEQDLSGITTRVGTLESTTTAHGTRLTNAETSISQNTDAIALRATKTEVQQVRPAYASSSTAAGTAAKVGTIDPAVTGYALYKGATVSVTFSTANTAATPTLNLNSTGAKQIRSYTGAALSEAEYKWAAGATIDLVYDGTYWRMQDGGAVKRVTAAEASIRVNADNIESKVSKDGVISSINQSAESVKIQASKVEIDGTAIFTAISSDVDDAITSKGYQTSSQVNSAITSKGYATTTQAQGYANTAKSDAISAAATDATTKANAAETNAKAYTDALEIGGRNLLRNSSVEHSQSSSTATWFEWQITDAPLETSQDYTFSFDAKTSNGTDVFYVGFANGSAATQENMATGIKPTTAYGRMSVTARTTKTNIRSIIVSSTKQYGRGNESNSGGTLYIKNVKLEKGNKPTDWTPAPEDVAADIAAAQATANAAAPKANAVKRTQRIWYRKSASGAPSTPGTASSNWVTKADDGNDAWTKMHIAISSTHKYIYTCEQYEMANGTVGYTSVLLDNTITVIDGGNLITGTVTANKLNAANINASKSLTVGAMTDAAASSILNSNVVVGGRNLFVSSLASNGYPTDKAVGTQYGITGMTANHEAYQLVPVEEGSSYIFQYWVDDSEHQGWVCIQLLDVDGLVVSKPARVYPNADYWTKTFTVPSGATTALISGRHLAVGYEYAKLKFEKGTKPTDWTPAPEDQEALALSSGIEYIAGTQTAATNVWTGVTKETALVAGKTIAYHLPFAGTSTAATLTLTLANGSTTAAIGVKYNSNNSAANNVTTHYGAGSVINMTYDGTYWRVSASYYDTTGISYARYRTQNPNYIKAAAACTSGHIICGTSSGYRDVAANVSFDLNYALMWCGKNIAANATGTENYLTYNSINVKTSGTVESATQYSTVYLKGTVDGKTFKIAASPFLTCKVPTSDDGFAYIPLGVAYNTTPSIYFNSSSDVYAFRNGEFQKLDSVAKYITAITDSGIRVHAKTNPTANYAAVDASGMDVVKGGVSVAKFGETARLGLESGYHTEVTSTGMHVSDGTDDVVRIHSEVLPEGGRWATLDIGKYADGTGTSVGGSTDDYTEDDYVYHERSAYLTASASTESNGAWVEAWAKHASTWDEDDTGITLRGDQLDLFGPNGEGYGSVSMENAGKVISTQSGMVTQSISASANAVTTYTVTFPNPYDAAPIVVACFYSTSSATAFGGLSLSVSAITTTSFTVKIFNNTSTGRSPGLFWIATPKTSQS